MYIWILLATIMVAFSFYNVAPRADKEHALNEVRAATIVNRFNAEHVAMLRTIECEVIRGTDNNDWDEIQGASSPVDVTAYNPNAAGSSSDTKFDYTEFADHLPIGYAGGKAGYSNEHIKHFVYCLKGDIENENVGDGETDISSHFVACNATIENNNTNAQNLGHHRYLVSVIPIPDRWKAKDGATPLPVLVNLLAKLNSGTTVYGWTDCESDGCTLRGLGANSINYYSTDANADNNSIEYEYELDDDGNFKLDDDNEKIKHEKYRKYDVNKVSLDKKSILWKNTDIMTLCQSTPCMLAYERIPWADQACHCENMVLKSEGKDPLTMSECYNTANVNHNSEYSTGKWKEFQKKMHIEEITPSNTNP